MSRACLLLSVLLTCLIMARPASAQDRERARAVFEEATRQFDAQNYLLALDGFEQAHALMEGDHRAQTLILFNIGRAQEELQRYRDALATFERYLAEAAEDAPYLAQTRDRVRELRLRVNAPADATSPATSAATSAGSNDVLTIVGIATLGVGAVLGGLSGFFFAERESNASVWNDDARCLPDNGGTRQSVCGDYQSAALDAETVGIGLAVGAGAALVGGAILVAIGASSGGGGGGHATFGCTGGPGLVGVACGGSF